MSVFQRTSQGWWEEERIVFLIIYYFKIIVVLQKDIACMNLSVLIRVCLLSSNYYAIDEWVMWCLTLIDFVTDYRYHTECVIQQFKSKTVELFLVGRSEYMSYCTYVTQMFRFTLGFQTQSALLLLDDVIRNVLSTITLNRAPCCENFFFIQNKRNRKPV